MMTRENGAKTKLITAMFIYGTVGLTVKYIPLPSAFIALVRGVIGTVFLLFLIFLGKRKPDMQAIKRNLPALLVSGACLGLNWVFLFEAYRYTTVAVASLCNYLAPVFVILVSPFLLKEKITPKKAACAACALLGMVFVSGVFDEGFGGVSAYKGIIFGVISGILYAAIIICNKFLKDIPSYDATAVQLLTTAALTLPYVLLTENVLSFTFETRTVILLLTVGIVHTGISYALYFGSMQSLGAGTIAIFSYTDPVVTILLSWLVLREDMTAFTAVGAVLILASTFISEISFDKANEKEAP